MTALDDLTGGHSLVLLTASEPEPPYDVLENRGFAYETAIPRRTSGT